MGINWAKKQQDAHRLILKYGGKAYLRRNGVDRECTAAILDEHPTERPGKVINPTDKVALVSAIGLTVAPDKELGDQLVTLVNASDPEVVDTVYRIVSPTGKLAPQGVPVYYELDVRA